MSPKRVATWRQGPFTFFQCSCGLEQAVNESMAYCGACGCEYDFTDGKVVLRPGRRTERFAVAKAITRAGGLRIGGG